MLVCYLQKEELLVVRMRFSIIIICNKRGRGRRGEFVWGVLTEMDIVNQVGWSVVL